MLTPREIAELCGLSYRSVLRAIEDGELRAFRLRGRLRVDNEDYVAWLEGARVTPTWHDPPTMQLRTQPIRASLRARHEADLALEAGGTVERREG